MRNERAWPQQCWKSCANGSNIVELRFGDHGTKEMLEVVGWKVGTGSHFAQQHETTSNNKQQGVQTYATCNIQQCWELLANNVAFVCTQPNIAVLNCRLYSSLSKCWEIQVSNGGTLWVFPVIAFDETILEIKGKIALPLRSSLTTSFVLNEWLTNREICLKVCCTFTS